MRIIVALIVLLSITSCGPSVKKFQELSSLAPIRRIALLPPRFPDSLRAERAEIIYSQLELKLRNAGYLLVDRSAISAICSQPTCPERSKIRALYDIDGVIESSFKSASNNSFLAGYIDELRGEILLRDALDKEVVAVSHFETETGGLLFNSGQLLEGLRSQVSHTGEAPFITLATKFAKAVVAKLPKAQGQIDQKQGGAIVLKQVRAQPIRPGVYQICAEGTSGIMASAIFESGSTNLREVTPGKYCGTYWLGKYASNLQVELRSFLGQAARAPLPLKIVTPCMLNDQTELQELTDRSHITVQCTPGSTQRTLSQCFATSSCDASRIYIYRARTALGPYQKIAQITDASWIDKNRPPYSYQLIVESKDGERSLPFSPKINSIAPTK